MAMEIISKLKREKNMLIAVIIFLFVALIGSNIYYNYQVYKIEKESQTICINNKTSEIVADVPQKAADGLSRKRKR